MGKLVEKIQFSPNGSELTASLCGHLMGIYTNHTVHCVNSVKADSEDSLALDKS